MWYKPGKPNEYLAVTGAGITTVKITKSGWILPLQHYQCFSIQPQDYSMSLQAMTKEKLQFLLPVVFTIGPDVNQRGEAAGQPPRDAGHNTEDRGDALVKYAMLLAEAQQQTGGNGGNVAAGRGTHIENIIKGIIEGETRVLVSSMSMEEIFSEREEFKKKIFRNIQGELDQFGLKIYNANVKELRDAPGSSYFESLSRKAHEGAINQARVDVAEALRLGNVGEAQRQGEQNRDIAKINADTAVQKTERDSERAQAEATLATRKTVFDRNVNIAQIEATRATEVRDEELRRDVEIKRAQTEVERLRATDVVKATIARESKQQAADAKNYEEQARSNAALYSEQKSADACAYKVRVEAEAKFLAAQKEAEGLLVKQQKSADACAYKMRVEAEAKFLAAQKEAEGLLMRQQKEAEGLLVRQQKEAEGLLVRQQKEAAGLSAMAGAYADLAQAFGGPGGLIQYMMIEKGVYTQLAKANADAVRGMNPKMTIWNTGSQAGSEGGAKGEGSGMGGVESIRNMYQMLPPLMTTINEQTGVVLPEWQFGKLAGDMSEREVSGKPIKGVGASNGVEGKGGKGANGSN